MLLFTHQIIEIKNSDVQYFFDNLNIQYIHSHIAKEILDIQYLIF